MLLVGFDPGLLNWTTGEIGARVSEDLFVMVPLAATLLSEARYSC